ncbi:MAG TPA: hypothetical protein VGJ33_09370 [Candidatus Angelobacter sp.]|jgi:hypothetical protein
MSPTKDFEKGLREALSAITPPNEVNEAGDCPEPELIACHVRGTKTDDAVGTHISTCKECGQFAADVRRRQKLYDRQKAAFTAVAEQKYSSVPILRETFRPFAWMLSWKALVPELAFVGVIFFVLAFNFRSVGPSFGPVTSQNAAVSTMSQIENSDPKKPHESAVLLDKFRDHPELVSQVDAARVAQARKVVIEKKAAVAGDTNLSNQWSLIEGKLQGYEFVAHYNSLKKQTDGVGTLGKVANVEGENGTITISFDQDPLTGSQDSKLLSTSAVETTGLNHVTILTPDRSWKLDSKNDFAVAAAGAVSHQAPKPQ